MKVLDRAPAIRPTCRGGSRVALDPSELDGPGGDGPHRTSTTRPEIEKAPSLPARVSSVAAGVGARDLHFGSRVMSAHDSPEGSGHLPRDGREEPVKRWAGRAEGPIDCPGEDQPH
jgi:hypothetical protein